MIELTRQLTVMFYVQMEFREVHKDLGKWIPNWTLTLKAIAPCLLFRAIQRWTQLGTFKGESLRHLGIVAPSTANSERWNLSWALISVLADIS